MHAPLTDQKIVLEPAPKISDPHLLVALALAFSFHGGLLPYTHGQTYDAFIHMFFGDHYYRSWFDPWEPRWYTGFNTTSYPPGTHQLLALWHNILPMRTAFVVVQLTGLVMLIIGIFRFSRIWVGSRAAGYAAIYAAFASSITETIHIFGQLPTIFSLGIFLNGMPHVHRWIVTGRLSELFLAVVFGAATTAAHHVTTLFGTVLFIGPIALHALHTHARERNIRLKRNIWPYAKNLIWPLLRGGPLAVLLISAIVITVFPYWYWSITDPITQVPIPHGSRESFLERRDLGLIFFVIPWGLSFFVLPYVVFKTFTSSLWPIGASVLLCFLLGTGGTTPIPRMLLGGAFDILTLDRFTFWASILILPFIGNLIKGLVEGRPGALLKHAFGEHGKRTAISIAAITHIMLACSIAGLPLARPMQPDFIEPAPIVKFMGQDEHYRWRYLTLGFGDQLAYLSAQMTAETVDGNYHSARRLPDLTRFSVERLENSKYSGVAGLGSLQQFLINADSYHLKYVFAADAFYDPLLYFTGWNPINRLQNGVVVWEKPDITPLPSTLPKRSFPFVHMMMWAVLPMSMLALAATSFLLMSLRRGLASETSRPFIALPSKKPLPEKFWIRLIVYGVAIAVLAGLALSAYKIYKAVSRPLSAKEQITAYYTDLDFRRYQEAFNRLDTEYNFDFETFMLDRRWKGGLVASYGKLLDVDATPIDTHLTTQRWSVTLTFVTALGTYKTTEELQTIKRGPQTLLIIPRLQATAAPERFQRRPDTHFNLTGIRQAINSTDIHRDKPDMPDMSLYGAKLVKNNGRFSIVGIVRNRDVDPAAVTIIANLRDEYGKIIARQAVGTHNGHRLLPSEATPFRLDFEGVLSLADERARNGYDPELFIPPEFDAPPKTADIEIKATASHQSSWQSIALNNVRPVEENGMFFIVGTAHNTGTKQASIVQLRLGLLNDEGHALDVISHYLRHDLRPGHGIEFKIPLSKREGIKVLRDIERERTAINGREMRKPGPNEILLKTKDILDLVELPPESGFSAVSISTATMIFQPLF